MLNVKPIGLTLPTNSKLNVSQCSKAEKDKAEIRKIPYALVVGSLMYVMVCTRPDIAYVVRTINHYMKNPRKEHWVAVK